MNNFGGICEIRLFFSTDVDDIDDIEMLPMENVRITWKGESFNTDAPGRLQDNWRSNTGKIIEILR